MRRLCRLICLYNVYTEHGALDLLYSSDMGTHIGSIGAGIGDTDTRPILIPNIGVGLSLEKNDVPLAGKKQSCVTIH